MPENLTDLLTRAEQAFEQGDQRGAGILANRILKQDFTHQGAWKLLYAMLGKQQTFDVFQQAFVNKYFPDKAQLLSAKPVVEATPPHPPVPSVLKQAIAANQATPLVTPTIDASPTVTAASQPEPAAFASQPASPFMSTTSMPIGEGANFCARCGKSRRGTHKFCPYCGYAFEGAVPSRASAPAGSQPMVMLPAQYQLNSIPLEREASRFSPKRIISILGALTIIGASFLPWAYSEAWLNSKTWTGIMTSPGQTAMGAGVVALVLLFALNNDVLANLLAIALGIGAGAAANNVMSSNGSIIHNFAGSVRNEASFGPQIVLVGAALIIGGLLAPARRKRVAQSQPQPVMMMPVSVPAPVTQPYFAPAPIQSPALPWFLILLAWGTLIVGFVPLPIHFAVNLGLQAAAFIFAVALTRSKNRAAKIHGRIVLVLWSIVQIAGFAAGFSIGARFL